MMFYSDVDWKSVLVRHHDMIEPYDDECLTPAGYDLRVGNTYLLSSTPPMKTLKSGDSFTIYPDDVALVKTLEQVNMPDDHSLSGLICSKVSLVSQGLSHISTTVDSDWKGELLIALHNYSPRPIVLEYGKKFCTIVLLENKSKSNRGSQHPSGRTDILLEQTGRLFDEKNSIDSKQLKNRKTAKILSVSFIVAICILSLLIAKFQFSENFDLVSSIFVIILPIIIPIVILSDFNVLLRSPDLRKQ